MVNDINLVLNVKPILLSFLLNLTILFTYSKMLVYTFLFLVIFVLFWYQKMTWEVTSPLALSERICEIF